MDDAVQGRSTKVASPAEGSTGGLGPPSAGLYPGVVEVYSPTIETSLTGQGKPVQDRR